MDSGDIDQALLALLGSDAQLLALAPNGVYASEAPPGMTRVVIVQLLDDFSEGVFGSRATENPLFTIEARGLIEPGKPAPQIKAAAARIDELLEGAQLVVSGFNTATFTRERRIRFIEINETEKSIRWDRRGGDYRCVCSVIGA